MRSDPGPGIQQATFTAAEIGREIFRFNNATIGDQPTMIEYQHGWLWIGAGGTSTVGPNIRQNWFDISNPRSPVLFRSIPSSGNKPHMAAFWADRMIDGYQANSFRIWDFDDQVVRNTYSGTVGPVWYMGQIPYVFRPRNGYSDATNLMEIADISSGNGRRLALIDLGAFVNFRIGALHAIGNILVASASQASGLATFDISNPASPRLLGTIVRGNPVYTSMVHGSRVYQCETNRGIRVYDFSDPANLREVGFISTGGNPRYVMLKEGKGYCVPGNNRLVIFNAQTLAIENNYQLPGSSDFVYPVGNMAMLGGSGGTNRTSIVAIQQQPDTAGPTVTFSSPSSRALNQPASSRIGLIMNEAVDVRSLTTNSFIVRPIGGSAISGTYSTQMGMVNFSPAQPLLADTTYEVVIPAGGIRDLVGNALTQPFSFRFSTGNNISDSTTNNPGPDGTIAHWFVNNTGADFSGNNRPLTLRNGATYSTERIEGSHSLNLDGTDDHAEAASIDLGNTFTFSAWVRIPEGRTNIQTIVANCASGSSTDGFKIMVNAFNTTDGQIRVETGNGTTSAVARTDSNLFQSGAWNHIAVAINRAAGIARIYHNGVDRTASQAIRTDFRTTGILHLGQMTSSNWRMAGQLDDIRIYPTLLTPSEVRVLAIPGLAAHWTFNNSPNDISGNDRTATLLNGAAYSTQSAEGSHSIQLDGTNDVVSGGIHNLGDQFTITMRARIADAANIRTLVANSPGGAATNGFRFFVNAFNTSNRQIVLETGNGATSASMRSAIGGFSIDEWNHIALVVDRAAALARIYYRGLELPLTGAVRNDFATQAELLLGSMANSTFPAQGHIDDVRVYRRALTAEEIAAVATGRNNPPAILNITTATSTQTVGQAATFTVSANDSDAGAALLYSFNFGDGTLPTAFSSSATAQHTYTAPGRYSVIVRVTDGTVTVSQQITAIVHHPLTPVAASTSSQILYDPARHKVWNVNPDADTITRLSATTLAKEAEIPVGLKPRSIALRPDGAALWVVCENSSELCVVDPVNATIINRVSLGYGYAPVAVAFAPNGSAGFIAAAGAEALLKVHPSTFAISAVDLGAAPSALSISGDSARVLASRFISPDHRGEVWEVSASTLAITRVFGLAFDQTPDAENSGRGVPNYLVQVAITPDGRRAWVPSKKDNIARGLFRDGEPMRHDNTVRSILSQVDLIANVEDLDSRVDVDNHSVPGAVCFNRTGDLAFVAYQLNNVVLVFDTATGNNLAGVQTGAAPQGLCLSPDGTRLYVHNFLSRTVAAYDVTGLIRGTSSEITPVANTGVVENERLSPEVLLGKRIFYDASDARMSGEGYISCASCHLDGDQDGRVWDFADRGEGLRNTTDLRGRRGMGHGFVHWSANFDELQDFEHDIRGAFNGAGFLTDAQFNSGTRNQPLGDAKAGLSPELDALAAYLTSLNEAPRSPYRTDGAPTAAAILGRQHFMALKCATCHGGADYTDSALGFLHNVGTLKPTSGQRLGGPLPGIDTPTLRGAWSGYPYLHDGSAADLGDVFDLAPAGSPHAAVRALGPSQRGELMAFLLELDSREADAPPSGTQIGGRILREYWTGIAGTTLAALTSHASYPNNPTGTGYLNQFEAVSWINPTVDRNWADNYGQRIRGWIHAPATGAYRFWISGDDNCELYLGTSASALSAVRIASVPGFTTFRQWTKYPEQRSGLMNLAAGQRYYIEVRHKEGASGDHVSVGWLRPGETGTIPSQIIPGSVLSPWGAGIWDHADIGQVGFPGGLVVSGDVFALRGSGADIWNNADGFHGAYRAISGDFTLTARVLDQDNTNPWAKAGVMVRESLAPNSRHASVFATPANGVSFQRRTATGGASASTTLPGIQTPVWIRAVRSGSLLSGYYSTNGAAWTLVGTVDLPMGSSVWAMLAVTSHDNALRSEALFDHVAIEAGGIAAPSPGYEEWASALAVDSSLRAPEADADGDGIANLLSYALFPTPGSATGARPRLRPQNEAGIEVSFPFAGRSDLIYIIEYTARLDQPDWTPMAVRRFGGDWELSGTELAVFESSGEVVFVDGRSLNGSGFWRLRVEI
jgi:DNA-binding beta-propeller fold protein YncE